MIRVLYFAQLREQVGTAAESLPGDQAPLTVADLAGRLAARGGAWATAFEFERGPVLLSAVNQSMAGPDTAIQDGDEVAFFPPVTGG